MKNQICAQIRFVAYLLLLGGFILLLRNLALSYQSFNPVYFGHYFKQELLSPSLLLSFGLVTRSLSKSIASWIAKGLQ